ncbi:hypothetical protein J6590_077890 [Homalodisca vitripennis]|nr:hypothetical protein J6590_077890 [Homalodisca vitripennis]
MQSKIISELSAQPRHQVRMAVWPKALLSGMRVGLEVTGSIPESDLRDFYSLVSHWSVVKLVGGPSDLLGWRLI